MRYKILLPLCLCCSILFAQQKPDKAYAIVGAGNNIYNWINVQEIDLSTGEVTRHIFDKEKTKFQLFDSKTRKELNEKNKFTVVADINNGDKTMLHQGVVTTAKEIVVHGYGSKDNGWKSVPPGAAINGEPQLNQKNALPATVTVTSGNGKVVKSGVVVTRIDRRQTDHRQALRAYESPTATMVAAAAYDQRHNKLFFTPMYVGELRWIDLHDRNSALKVFCVTDQPLTPKEKQNETTQITRMVIAADGNGYALSNDANYFIRFTTGKQPAITPLGALKDDRENNDNSIHSRNMYGGDMIADAFGSLYLITASANVFKIDINTKEAKYLGSIQGLPKRYTTNGAAININGDLIVSSATAADGYFKVDLDNLKAEKVDVKNLVNSSDLASGNLAFDKRKRELSNASLKAIDLTMSNGKVTVFPNPVLRDNFKVNFKQSQAGQYDVQLVDLSGKIVFQKRVNVGIINQTETLVVDNGLAKGVYMLKIVDRSKKLISSGNLVLQ